MVKFREADTILIGNDTAWPDIGKHDCNIPSEMDHGMHLLSPNASYFQRWLRMCRKLTLPTYAHRLCRYYYPTRKSIVAAWMKTSATKCPPIIHPFSTLALFWQTIMLIVWTYLSMSRPLTLAFAETKGRGQEVFHVISSYKMISIVCAIGSSGILLLNILMNFFTGYRRCHGKGAVVLKFSDIGKKYLCTYFIFDLIDAIPFAAYIGIVRNVGKGWMLVHVIQIVRAGTVLEYAKNVGHLMGAKDVYVHAVCSLYLIVLIIHWLTCILQATPYLTTHSSIIEHHTWEDYIRALNKVTSHFFLGSCSVKVTELIPVTITLIIGFIFRIAIIGTLLNMLIRYDRTPVQFHSYLREAKLFMKEHAVTWNLQQRINLFIKHKYQGKYYKASRLAQMSEHLHYEIYLHYCGHLICTMQLCKYLKREVIGEVMVSLRPVFYHAGDVVYAVNDICENLVFISHGKIAAYTDVGMEVTHFADGNVLGLIGFFISQHHVWTMVAIEPTEAFVWRRSDILRIVARHTDLGKHLLALFDKQYEQFKVLTKTKRIVKFNGPTANIYLQLGNKRIIEQRLPRKQLKEEWRTPHQCASTRSSVTPFIVNALGTERRERRIKGDNKAESKSSDPSRT